MRSLVLLALSVLFLSCAGPAPETPALEERRALDSSLQPVLGPALLGELGEEDLQELLAGPLVVEEPLARRWAEGYAAARLGLDEPVVRLVLPVTDSEGELIARQVILSTSEGPEGFEGLSRELEPLLSAAAGEPFRQIHLQTAGRYATVYVAAHRFRHPLREAHGGVPRWLAEAGEVRRACLHQAQPTPEGIVDAGGAPLREVVQWRCEGGAAVGFSHYADVVVPDGSVGTIHSPALVFRRWAGRVGDYDDPAARLEHIDALWSRFVAGGES